MFFLLFYRFLSLFSLSFLPVLTGSRSTSFSILCDLPTANTAGGKFSGSHTGNAPSNSNSGNRSGSLLIVLLAVSSCYTHLNRLLRLSGFIVGRIQSFRLDLLFCRSPHL